jgi:predicted Zn-dependent protease
LVAAFSLTAFLCTVTYWRNTIKLYPSSQLNEMGVQAFDAIKKQHSPSDKGRENQYVQCVADAITAVVPKRVFSGKWEVVVFKDDLVNAFALPGGKIGVYTGLLKVASNQDQLAAVIGHEVAHVIAEHGNERMSSSALIGLGMQATNALLENNKVSQNDNIMAAIGLGMQVGVQLPFSRTHESEADLIGLELMSKAGFNPSEAVMLWQNMAKASGGAKQPELLSTHPLPQTRIRTIQQHIPKVMPLFSNTPVRPNC